MSSLSDLEDGEITDGGPDSNQNITGTRDPPPDATNSSSYRTTRQEFASDAPRYTIPKRGSHTQTSHYGSRGSTSSGSFQNNRSRPGRGKRYVNSRIAHGAANRPYPRTTLAHTPWGRTSQSSSASAHASEGRASQSSASPHASGGRTAQNSTSVHGSGGRGSQSSTSGHTSEIRSLNTSNSRLANGARPSVSSKSSPEKRGPVSEKSTAKTPQNGSDELDAVSDSDSSIVSIPVPEKPAPELIVLDSESEEDTTPDALRELELRKKLLESVLENQKEAPPAAGIGDANYENTCMSMSSEEEVVQHRQNTATPDQIGSPDSPDLTQHETREIPTQIERLTCQTRLSSEPFGVQQPIRIPSQRQATHMDVASMFVRRDELSRRSNQVPNPFFSPNPERNSAAVNRYTYPSQIALQTDFSHEPAPVFGISPPQQQPIRPLQNLEGSTFTRRSNLMSLNMYNYHGNSSSIPVPPQTQIQYNNPLPYNQNVNLPYGYDHLESYGGAQNVNYCLEAGPQYSESTPVPSDFSSFGFDLGYRVPSSEPPNIHHYGHSLDVDMRDQAFCTNQLPLAEPEPMGTPPILPIHSHVPSPILGGQYVNLFDLPSQSEPSLPVATTSVQIIPQLSQPIMSSTPFPSGFRPLPKCPPAPIICPTPPPTTGSQSNIRLSAPQKSVPSTTEKVGERSDSSSRRKAGENRFSKERSSDVRSNRPGSNQPTLSKSRSSNSKSRRSPSGPKSSSTADNQGSEKTSYYGGPENVGRFLEVDSHMTANRRPAPTPEFSRDRRRSGDYNSTRPLVSNDSLYNSRQSGPNRRRSSHDADGWRYGRATSRDRGSSNRQKRRSGGDTAERPSRAVSRESEERRRRRYFASGRKSHERESNGGRGNDGQFKRTRGRSAEQRHGASREYIRGENERFTNTQNNYEEDNMVDPSSRVSEDKNQRGNTEKGKPESHANNGRRVEVVPASSPRPPPSRATVEREPSEVRNPSPVISDIRFPDSTASSASIEKDLNKSKDDVDSDEEELRARLLIEVSRKRLVNDPLQALTADARFVEQRTVPVRQVVRYVDNNSYRSQSPAAHELPIRRIVYNHNATPPPASIQRTVVNHDALANRRVVRFSKPGCHGIVLGKPVTPMIINLRAQSSSDEDTDGHHERRPPTPPTLSIAQTQRRLSVKSRLGDYYVEPVEKAAQIPTGSPQPLPTNMSLQVETNPQAEAPIPPEITASIKQSVQAFCEAAKRNYDQRLKVRVEEAETKKTAEGNQRKAIVRKVTLAAQQKSQVAITKSVSDESSTNKLTTPDISAAAGISLPESYTPNASSMVEDSASYDAYLPEAPSTNAATVAEGSAIHGSSLAAVSAKQRDSLPEDSPLTVDALTEKVSVEGEIVPRLRAPSLKRKVSLVKNSENSLEQPAAKKKKESEAAGGSTLPKKTVKNKMVGQVGTAKDAVITEDTAKNVASTEGTVKNVVNTEGTAHNEATTEATAKKAVTTEMTAKNTSTIEVTANIAVATNDPAKKVVTKKGTVQKRVIKDGMAKKAAIQGSTGNLALANKETSSSDVWNKEIANAATVTTRSGKNGTIQKGSKTLVTKKGTSNKAANQKAMRKTISVEEGTVVSVAVGKLSQMKGGKAISEKMTQAHFLKSYPVLKLTAIASTANLKSKPTDSPSVIQKATASPRARVTIADIQKAVVKNAVNAAEKLKNSSVQDDSTQTSSDQYKPMAVDPVLCPEGNLTSPSSSTSTSPSTSPLKGNRPHGSARRIMVPKVMKQFPRQFQAEYAILKTKLLDHESQKEAQGKLGARKDGTDSEGSPGPSGSNKHLVTSSDSLLTSVTSTSPRSPQKSNSDHTVCRDLNSSTDSGTSSASMPLEKSPERRIAQRESAQKSITVFENERERVAIEKILASRKSPSEISADLAVELILQGKTCITPPATPRGRIEPNPVPLAPVIMEAGPSAELTEEVPSTSVSAGAQLVETTEFNSKLYKPLSPNPKKRQRQELLLRERLLKASLVRKITNSNYQLSLKTSENQLLTTRSAAISYLDTWLEKRASLNRKIEQRKKVAKQLALLRNEVMRHERILIGVERHVNRLEDELGVEVNVALSMEKKCSELVEACADYGRRTNERDYEAPAQQTEELKQKFEEFKKQNKGLLRIPPPVLVSRNVGMTKCYIVNDSSSDEEMFGTWGRQFKDVLPGVTPGFTLRTDSIKEYTSPLSTIVDLAEGNAEERLRRLDPDVALCTSELLTGACETDDCCFQHLSLNPKN